MPIWKKVVMRVHQWATTIWVLFVIFPIGWTLGKLGLDKEMPDD